MHMHIRSVIMFCRCGFRDACRVKNPYRFWILRLRMIGALPSPYGYTHFGCVVCVFFPIKLVRLLKRLNQKPHMHTYRSTNYYWFTKAFILLLSLPFCRSTVQYAMKSHFLCVFVFFFWFTWISFFTEKMHRLYISTCVSNANSTRFSSFSWNDYFKIWAEMRRAGDERTNEGTNKKTTLKMTMKKNII